MLKILLVHNDYGSAAPSGENQVFAAELALLRAHGHAVETFTRHSDEIRAQGAWGAVRGALATAWNPWMTWAIRRAVERFRPAVVHVHNTFPLISPGIFPAIGPRAARVLTLHNYRLFCPAAIPLRDGRVCTDCLAARSSWPALRHGCYRHSRLATLPLAFSVALHRTLNTWTQQVDAFIALSDFQRQLMTQSGLPAARVYVKPNFYPGHPQPVPWPDRQDYAVFAGRLTAEKGVETLIRAWTRWGRSAPELRILGDGPLRAALERLAAAAPTAPIRFFGQVSAQEAERHIAGGKLLVLPLEWFEGFPMVLREAFAFGTPLASKLLGGQIHDRITGSDVFWGLNQRLNARGGCSCFFLGSTEDTLRQITTRMARDYPNIRVAGVYAPPFKAEFSPDDDDAMLAAINTARPDVLWVGMTAPKQEKWIDRHQDRLDVKFSAAVGAVFDFYSGRVKRSHPVFQRLGLEWLPRLLQQPRRLWPRMGISAPIFLWHVLRQRPKVKGPRPKVKGER